MLSWAAVFIAVLHAPLNHALQNCSALHAFVEVRGKNTTNRTLSSAQALFPPHAYHSVSWSPLIALPVDHDICDGTSSFPVAITNKIVLLFEESGNCSAQFKVLSAQQHGASAVLLANADPNGNIKSIPDDDELKGDTTTIPMRSISLQDGELLYDELTAEGNVEVKIGCFDSDYPTALCVKEPTGQFSSFSGSYQRQDYLVNDHPIWKLPGSPNLRNDIHIFLHDGHGEEDWYWAATSDMTFKYDSSIRLRCATGGSSIADPTLCPVWYGTKNWGATFFSIPEMNVSSHLCEGIGQKICVDSYQHKLEGIRGTYISTIPGDPFWLRQLTQCDHRNGFISYVEEGYYGTGYFVLHEPLNKWQIAICIIPRNQSENGTFATAKWRPDLCNFWVTRNDYDLRYSPKHRTHDPTFNITMGACSAERAVIHQPPCFESDPPETMCFANNSIMHGNVMGEYEKLNETGPIFNTPIYARIDYDDPLRRNTSILYIWYTNEAWTQLNGVDLLHYRKWVISEDTIEDAVEKRSYKQYGHCMGYSYGNPFQCQGWVFYASAYHYDEQMTISDSECTQDPFPTVPRFWPFYICIGFHNTSTSWAHKWSALHKHQLVGAFARNTSFVDTDTPIPIWQKSHNDLETSAMYIIFSNVWIVMNTSTVLMYCNPYSSSATMNPLECTKWYDFNWELLDNIYFYECTEEDVLTASPTFSPTSAPTLSPTATPLDAEICLSRGGTISSLLEGIFVETGANEDEHGAIEFVSTNKNLEVPLYLLYHEDFWWLTHVNYTTFARISVDASAVDVYGYCRSGKRGKLPVCRDCWMFFWQISSLDTTLEMIEDCSFMIHHDSNDCDTSGQYTGDVSAPDALCVNKLDGKADRDESHPYGKLSEVPEPSVIINKNIGIYTLMERGFISYVRAGKSVIYIWHDEITNNWLISLLGDNEDFGVDDLRSAVRLFMCDGSDTGDAMHVLGRCWDFDWDTMQSVAVNNVLSIGEICNSEKHESDGKVVGTVVGIILSVICCGGIIFIWLHCQNEDKHQRLPQETEIVAASTKILTGSKAKTHSVRTNDDVDDDGIPAYDMTILNEDQELDEDGNDLLTTA